MKMNLRSSLSLIFDKTYSFVCDVDPPGFNSDNLCDLHQRRSFAEKAQAVTLGGLSASLGGATIAATAAAGLSLARRRSGRSGSRRWDNGRRYAAGRTSRSAIYMLIIGPNLPAESDAVQLLDTVWVHARRLALPVQLVLTTLALDPVNSIEDGRGIMWNLASVNSFRVNPYAHFQLHG